MVFVAKEVLKGSEAAMAEVLAAAAMVLMVQNLWKIILSVESVAQYVSQQII